MTCRAGYAAPGGSGSAARPGRVRSRKSHTRRLAGSTAARPPTPGCPPAGADHGDVWSGADAVTAGAAPQRVAPRPGSAACGCGKAAPTEYAVGAAACSGSLLMRTGWRPCRCGAYDDGCSWRHGSVSMWLECVDPLREATSQPAAVRCASSGRVQPPSVRYRVRCGSVQVGSEVTRILQVAAQARGRTHRTV